MNKEEIYQELLPKVAALIQGETDEVGVQANVSAALKEALGFFWVGFYTVRDGKSLRLGPFQGSPACYSIPYGKGVCGTAWEKKETLVVPDVHAFPGHIACSSLSRSEIVVPVFDLKGEVRCIIDIDSDQPDAFDTTDKLYLEMIAGLLTESLYAE
ncbi:MAG: GAF domain-containing protein [Prevotella sp.]|nr:GAF domain-containing protein [Prevotella sp.]